MTKQKTKKNKPGQGRPKIPDSEKRINLTIRVTQQTRSALSKICAEKKISIGKFFDWLVENIPTA